LDDIIIDKVLPGRPIVDDFSIFQDFSNNNIIASENGLSVRIDENGSTIIRTKAFPVTANADYRLSFNVSTQNIDSISGKAIFLSENIKSLKENEDMAEKGLLTLDDGSSIVKHIDIFKDGQYTISTK